MSYEEYEVRSFTIRTPRALAVHMEPYQPLLKHPPTPGHGPGTPFQTNPGPSLPPPPMQKDADLQLC